MIISMEITVIGGLFLEPAFIFVLGIILICSAIPITAIVTAHLRGQTKLRLEALKYEIELEKQRKESYLIESEKLRLEIEQTRQHLALEQPFTRTHVNDK